MIEPALFLGMDGRKDHVPGAHVFIRSLYMDGSYFHEMSWCAFQRKIPQTWVHFSKMFKHLGVCHSKIFECSHGEVIIILPVFREKSLAMGPFLRKTTLRSGYGFRGHTQSNPSGSTCNQVRIQPGST